MNKKPNFLEKLRFWIEKRGLDLLQLSVAVIFIWFGVLKFFPGNAAEALAINTISWLSGGALKEPIALYLLGGFECLLGFGLLFRRALNVIVPLLYLQLCGTVLPLAIFPEKTWIGPFMPTLEGQYIIKNVVIIAAAIVIGAKGRGSKLIVDPELAQKAGREQEHKGDAF